jgi:hypothetical protein
MTVAPPGGRRLDKFDCALVRPAPHLAAALADVRYITEQELCSSCVSSVRHAYMALGYPVSKNRKIDHAHKTVQPQKLSYACNVLSDDAFAKTLGIDGDDHLFAKYEKRSQDFSGVVFNSVSPIGLSGGALIDLGSGDPLKPTKLPRHPFGLAGVLIEIHHKEKRMVAVKIEAALRVLQGQRVTPRSTP